MGSKNKEVEPYHIFLSPYHITYPIYPYMIIKWRIFLVTAQRFSFRSSQSDSYHWRKPLGAGGLVRCNGQVSDGLPPDVLHDIFSHPAHRYTQILREKAPHLSVVWWAGGQPHVISKSIVAVSPTNHPQLENRHWIHWTGAWQPRGLCPTSTLGAGFGGSLPQWVGSDHIYIIIYI